MMKFREMMNHICRGRHPNVNTPLGRVCMYIGNKPTLYAFQAFIAGYICGAPKEEAFQWHHFDEWMRHKLNINGCQAMSMCLILAKMKYGNGRKGVAKLIELWREYEAVRSPSASNEERQENQEKEASEVGQESK